MSRRITARSAAGAAMILETFFLAEDKRSLRTQTYQDLLR
jgi:hypothetical protein